MKPAFNGRSRSGRPRRVIPRSRSAEGTDAESGTEAISLKRKESGGLPIAVGCTRSKTGRVPCLHLRWAEQCEPDILLYRSPYKCFPLKKTGCIHRGYLETSPRHCPGRSGRGAPVSYGGKALGRLTLTADGRMMSVVCDGRTELPAGVRREYSSYCDSALEGDGFELSVPREEVSVIPLELN
jgi:hypothetical protein